MPNMIVCYKWVMSDQDIRVDKDTGAIKTDKAKYVISEYDKNAIEIAVQVKEKDGGTVAGLSFGLPILKNSLKDALSRGLDSVTWISDPKADLADAGATATILAGAIQLMNDLPDAIFCGDGSADFYSQQVAQRLAARLGMPVVDNVEDVIFEGGFWRCRRQLRDTLETVRVKAPAVISVLPGIARPRLPGMKQILGAGKKPQHALTLADLQIETVRSATCMSGLKGAVQNRKNVIIRETDADYSVKRLIEALKHDGVL